MRETIAGWMELFGITEVLAAAIAVSILCSLVGTQVMKNIAREKGVALGGNRARAAAFVLGFLPAITIAGFSPLEFWIAFILGFGGLLLHKGLRAVADYFGWEWFDKLFPSGDLPQEDDDADTP